MIKRNPAPTEPTASQAPIEGPLPVLETIEMRELDFTFTGPVVFSVSLEPEDTFVVDSTGWGTITFQRNGEVAQINTHQLLYMSNRPRTIQRKVKHGA